MNKSQEITHSTNKIEVRAALDDIHAALERLLSGVARLKSAFEPAGDIADFDPRDPANKYEVGGLEKLTDRGIEICYRLFDAGKTRYAVKEMMGISFGAATHRYKTWEKEGGVNRIKKSLD